MSKLHLDFLEQPTGSSSKTILSILDDFANELTRYGKDYLKGLVTNTITGGQLSNCSLYVIAYEIRFEYKVISVDLTGFGFAKITYFTLATNQVSHLKVSLSNGLDDFEQEISNILSSDLFNQSLRYVVNGIRDKRENNAQLH
jgi:hypothetical protein